jgi:hypothetical protein
MTKEINMQHMTMREYVSIAILGEMTAKKEIWEALAEGTADAKSVVKQSFAWADVWMMVREERNAKTQTT